MKARWIFFLAMISLLAASHRMIGRIDSNATAAPVETVTTVPLYRLVNGPGIHYYTTSVANRDDALQHRGYRDEGIAGYVLPKKAHGAVPLSHLSSVTRGWAGQVVSDKHFYSTDKAEIDKAVAQGWTLEEVVGYVAPSSNPMLGTVELYWLYNPLTKSSIKKPLFKTETRIAALSLSDDDNFYTTDFKERQRAIAGGYQAMGTTAYIWRSEVAVALKAPPKAMPDLIVEKTSVEGTTVTAVIRNDGQHNISSEPGIDVMFRILERDGKQVFSTVKTLKGMSPGQAQEVTFDTLNHNQTARNYQIRVDHLNKVSEADESNNATTPTPLMRIKIKNDPSSAGKLSSPSITIVGRRDVPPKLNTPHEAFFLAISNWDQYPADRFQSTKGLMPSSPCGDTRMQLRITIYKGGKFFKGDCKRLNAPEDLKSVETISSKLDDTDEIDVTLVDRLTNETLRSGRYKVGWYGVADLLKTVGCKYFLGRASSYLCMNDKGFAACENLRQKGKPIECRQAGK